MKYTPWHSNWFYSLVNIPDLVTIQQELLQVRDTDTHTWSTNKFYKNVAAAPVLHRCPVLSQYLNSVGLLKNTVRFLYSQYLGSNVSTPHVDAYDPIFCSESLNIPLVDCENSYTVWYSTDREKLIDSTGAELKHSAQYALCPSKDAVEIKRLHAIAPAVVNTTILHKADAQSDSRVVCGIRFNRALTRQDMYNLGIARPFVQE